MPLPPPGDALALAEALVRVDSRNPALEHGGPGETACAGLLARTLEHWGFAVEVTEAAPGRPNVIARIGPTGGARILFNGHLDTVGVAGMTHPPYSAGVLEGRLYGRGACDMKGGIAAMCAAAWHANRSGQLDCEAVIAAVADEEDESIGTRALIAAGLHADAAVVTEPTRLAIVPAHKGFAWTEVEFRGRAAHGSQYDVGVDAIRHAGLLLAEMHRWEKEELLARTHPLLGRGSWHAGTIAGGSAFSVYPDLCTLRLERRSLPGEPVGDGVDEIERMLTRVREQGTEVSAGVRPVFAQHALDIDVSEPVVRGLQSAAERTGIPATIAGLSAWTDAALLSAAGIPAVCFGPGDIALAHAAEEWVPVREIEMAALVLTALLLDWTATTR